VSRPRILSISGGNFFFTFVLFEMIEFSQEFKTLSLFESFIRKTILNLLLFSQRFSASLLAKRSLTK
jgi:hypothetical protein